MMLSSVAERLYWMSRYLERAQDTAKLLQTYSHVIMDLPIGTGPPWEIVVDILDARAVFESKYKQGGEKNVVKFLTSDKVVPCSIPFSVNAARENVRTSRDVLPEESWELVNELHLYISDNASSSWTRRNRYEYLSEVVSRCRVINALLMDSLPRDHSYGFIKLGRLIECADMTSRVMDIGAGNIMSRSKPSPLVDTVLWRSLLHALSAETAYRRAIGPIIEETAAVNFVFNDPVFPRSMKYCVRAILDELTWFKHNDLPIKAAERLRRGLRRTESVEMTSESVHALVDDFQHQLNSLDLSIRSTWFV